MRDYEEKSAFKSIALFNNCFKQIFRTRNIWLISIIFFTYFAKSIISGIYEGSQAYWIFGKGVFLAMKRNYNYTMRQNEKKNLCKPHIFLMYFDPMKTKIAITIFFYE